MLGVTQIEVLSSYSRTWTRHEMTIVELRQSKEGGKPGWEVRLLWWHPEYDQVGVEATAWSTTRKLARVAAFELWQGWYFTHISDDVEQLGTFEEAFKSRGQNQKFLA